MAELFGVVMAGGRGTRFWPLSRERLPKQLLRLLGPESLLERTLERLKPLIAPEQLLVVTCLEQARLVRRHLGDLPRENLLVEPEGRGTAACIALAACEIERRQKGASMAVFPADHVIANEEEFRRVVKAAAGLLRSRPEALVTFGMKPTHPATGYGYIRRGAEVARASGWPVYSVEAFVEKPDASRARRFVRSPRYLWNGGMFLWRTDSIRTAFETHLPEIASAMEGMASALAKRDSTRRLRSIYAGLPSISVDHGVLERARDVLVVPCDVGWSDVGSWKSLAEVLEVDEEGNVALGRHVGLDTSGTVVVAPGQHLVATIGVEDLVIVVTQDAVLVCPKDRDQDVRQLVDILQARGLGHHL
jgi:mannose-1-phosphate guanylyltransferase